MQQNAPNSTVVKGSMSKDLDIDNTLVKLQTLMLDAVAPSVHIVETAQSGNLTIDTSVKAAKLAMHLLVNASAHVSKERRKMALKDLNKDLLTLAFRGRLREDDERAHGGDAVHKEDLELQD